MKYDEYLLTGKYPKAPVEPKPVETIQYVKDPGPTSNFHKIILGRSVIRVDRNALIKTQVDRVTRDWLLAFHVKGEPWDYKEDDHVSHHEGAKLTELVEYTDARVVPVWGMRATKIGETWYAPDAAGLPRFEISEDKVNNYSKHDRSRRSHRYRERHARHQRDRVGCLGCQPRHWLRRPPWEDGCCVLFG